ncbi:MAG: CBS domain-containing protein [Anaerolineae bacterium]|nr:CBS domain-containing protein [Anaerolineae bacterium]
MLVAERMSRQPVAVSPDLPLPEALRLMREKRVRRLPVVDESGRLIGIVSEKDLLYAAPSPATTLSIYEMQYLLTRITVKDVMTSEVFTVRESNTIEEAARLMVQHKIGGLPVVDDAGKLIGIITETDLFKTFLELLGGWEHGVRATVLILDQKGELCRLAEVIAGIGGNIVSLGTFMGEDPATRQILLKIADVGIEELTQALQPAVLKVLDIRET